jgi:hypothetical protein
MRVSAAICLGAAVSAAVLVRKSRHADQRQAMPEAA